MTERLFFSLSQLGAALVGAVSALLSPVRRPMGRQQVFLPVRVERPQRHARRR